MSEVQAISYLYSDRESELEVGDQKNGESTFSQIFRPNSDFGGEAKTFKTIQIASVRQPAFNVYTVPSISITNNDS